MALATATFVAYILVKHTFFLLFGCSYHELIHYLEFVRRNIIFFFLTILTNPLHSQAYALPILPEVMVQAIKKCRMDLFHSLHPLHAVCSIPYVKYRNRVKYIL